MREALPSQQVTLFGHLLTKKSAETKSDGSELVKNPDDGNFEV